MDKIYFDCFKPITSIEIGKADSESNKVFLTYQKFTLFLPKEERKIGFCCLLDSKDLAASSLTFKPLKASDYKFGESYLKSLGVNCYSFAAGRSPLSTGDDPVPGAFCLQQLRISLCAYLNLKDAPKKNKANLLEEGKLNIDNLAKFPDQNKLNKFTQAFFGRSFENLEKDEITLLMDFLTKGYQVPENSPYLSREVTDRLLQLDGLIKIYPECDKRDLSDCEFGRVFLAAFVNPKSDYHFMRYFKDGWYERVGDQIRKRPNMQAEIPFPKSDKEMLFSFKSLENNNDLEDFQFVGYYVVPTTIVLADKIGRKYILEHHKV